MSLIWACFHNQFCCWVMRIIKKERADVKKLMEQMKYNKSHRSYTSIENKTENTSNTERKPGELYHSYSKNTSIPSFYSNFNQDSHVSLGSASFPNYNSYNQAPQSTCFPQNNSYQHQPVFGISQSFGQMSQFNQQNHSYGPSQGFPMSQVSQSFGQVPYAQPSCFGNSVEMSNSRLRVNI